MIKNEKTKKYLRNKKRYYTRYNKNEQNKKTKGINKYGRKEK